MSRTNDLIRQGLNLILPFAMWISSSWPELTGQGRSISEQSDASSTLLVPFGAAFSIWFPIFIGCIAYGIIQSLPKNRDRAIFRDIGWLTAGSFALIALWGWAAAFPPENASRWLTALIFIPAMLLMCQAVVMATRRKAEFLGAETYAIRWPLSWLAGWCSLAIFLNWAQLGIHGPIGFGLPVLAICMLTLAAALGWVVIMLRRTGGSYAYVFPVVWGLGFLALDRLVIDEINRPIGVTAIIGALVLIGTTVKISRDAKLT